MKYLRYIITTAVVTTIFGGYFYYLTVNGQIEQNPISNAIVAVSRPYPELTNPREVSLSCDYHGKNLIVNETLYGSLYDYYRTDPTKKSAYLHSKEEDFVFTYEKDNTVRDLSKKILAVGAANSLTNDQILDLSACFIQGIPYDEAKASLILGPDFDQQAIADVIPRYPYETLYDKTGICTDKTYLGAAIMRELGYGVSILTFDDQKHMSLGVLVPAGYGSFGTNYGIMELTGSGFLVGDVPELNASAGLAINNYETLHQDNITVDEEKQLKLATPSGVIDLAGGSTYVRIIDRSATKIKIEHLKPQLTALQTTYKQATLATQTAESNLATAEAKYKASQTNSTYAMYIKAYNNYLDSYNNAQAKINQYNKAVNLYNSYVEEYKLF
jgi:hypothetical protein